jgi:hypothetical protein
MNVFSVSLDILETLQRESVLGILDHLVSANPFCTNHVGNLTHPFSLVPAATFFLPKVEKSAKRGRPYHQSQVSESPVFIG